MQIPSPSFLPPRVLKGVTLNCSEEAADLPARQPALVPAGRVGTAAGRESTASTEPPGGFLILSQEPPGLQAPCLYEITAFCPAFDANRMGETRSEHRSACPFCLKLAWAFTGGKRLTASH